MKTVLVVDDDEKICWAFQEFLEDEGFRSIIANNAEEGLKRIKSESPDIVLLDVRLPGMDGLEALRQIKQVNPDIYVIIMTAYRDPDTTIKSMQLEAYDFLPKPIDLDKVKELLNRAVKSQEVSRKLQRVENLPKETKIDKLIGQSSAMQEIYKLIGSLTTNNVTVLLEGESGTGKELVAKSIHYNSLRKDKRFVAVNCGALPDTLLESELFGYEKGAFTNADSRKLGKFEIADGGTLFLDEISNMSPALQVKLLRFLQEKEFEHLGGNESIKVDVRIIAATNEDLAYAVRVGKFRNDLYYRLKLISINLPPLRERIEDVPLLVEYFIKKTNAEFGKSLKGIDEKVMKLLMRYNWPGNVRELENVIKSAAVLSRTDVILPEHLPREIIDYSPKTSDEFSNMENSLDSALKPLVQKAVKLNSESLYDEVIGMAERVLLKLALEVTEKNQSQAASLLGISRTTLLKKTKEYGI